MATDGFLELGRGLEISSVPAAPQVYPIELDARVLRKLESFLTMEDREQARAQVGRLLQNFPLSRLLALLEQNPDFKVALADLVVPQLRDWAKEYAQSNVPYPIESLLSGMTPEAELRFGLMTLKSPSTGEHSLDVRAMSGAIGWVLTQEDSVFASSYLPYREQVDLASVNHDLGKADIATLFLMAPFSRDAHLPSIFRANLVSPKRKRAIKGLHCLSPEQEAYFAPILVPRTGMGALDDTLVEELMTLLMGKMKEQKFAFHSIPLRFLAKVMRDMKDDGAFPDYVEGLEGQKIDPAFLPFLAGHQEDLHQLELIFAIHEMDGYELTLRDVIDKHEAGSVALVRGQVQDCVERFVGSHHGYSLTSKLLGPNWGAVGALRVPGQVVPMADVGSALAQVGRPYWEQARGKPALMVSRIFTEELTAKGLADPTHITTIAELIRKNDASAGAVSWQFHNNVLDGYGAPWTKPA